MTLHHIILNICTHYNVNMLRHNPIHDSQEFTIHISLVSASPDQYNTVCATTTAFTSVALLSILIKQNCKLH